MGRKKGGFGRGRAVNIKGSEGIQEHALHERVLFRKAYSNNIKVMMVNVPKGLKLQI